MKMIKILIYTFLIFISSCKTETKNENIIKPKYVNLLWRKKNFDWIPTTLMTKNKMLYFGNSKNEFYSVNIETSEVDLKILSDYNPFYKSLICDQNIFFQEYGNDLNCFEPNGKLKWKINGEINLRKDLAEYENCIYGSVNGNGFSKMNKFNGKVIWHLPKDSNITETNNPEFYKETIFLGLQNQTAKILAIKNKNGTILWQKEFENFKYLNQVKTKKGLLVCINKDFKKGKILMLDYKNGNEVWSNVLNCDTYYKPCILNDNIILSTYDNKIISLNIEIGKTNWMLNLKKDQAESRIISFRENLYFGTMNRNLYNLNSRTGKINFIQPFNYGISTPMVENGKIYFPTGGSEIWVLK